MIMRCDCTSAIQDELNGKSNRVHNELGKSPAGSKQYRCTVCGKTKSMQKDKDAK
jgi:transposase-like protein